MNEINRNDKIRRERNRARKAAYLRFTTGLRQLILLNRWKNIFVVTYLLIAVFAWDNRGKLLFGLDGAFPLFPVLTIAVDWLVALLLLLGLLCLISAIGTPRKAQQIGDRLIGAGAKIMQGNRPCSLQNTSTLKIQNLQYGNLTKTKPLCQFGSTRKRKSRGL